MSVLHIDTGRELRGGQTQLAAFLGCADESMHVAVPTGAPSAALYRQSGAVVHEIRLGAWPRGSHALRALVRELDPALLVAQTSHAHTHALFAAQGRPVVVHRRVDFVVGQGIIGRWKYRQPRSIIAVSHAVKGILVAAGVSAHRVHVVHDGVDPQPTDWTTLTLPTILPSLDIQNDPNARIVLCAGALVDHKDHATLIAAAALVIASEPNTHFVMAGEGPNRERLFNQIQALNLGHRVHLIGHHPSLWRLMHGCQLFCHSSVEEGLGSVIIEAMLAGMAVVSTQAGGAVEVVDDGVTGILVPTQSPDQLAKAITDLLADEPLRQKMGQAGKIRARDQFSVASMAAKTMSVYQDAGAAK